MDFTIENEETIKEVNDEIKTPVNDEKKSTGKKFNFSKKRKISECKRRESIRFAVRNYRETPIGEMKNKEIAKEGMAKIRKKHC